MEYLVFTSTILHLAGLISRQHAFAQPMYNNNMTATHHHTLRGQRSSFPPGLVSGHFVCPRFVYSQQPMKRKRKRGGRFKPMHVFGLSYHFIFTLCFYRHNFVHSDSPRDAYRPHESPLRV